MYLFGLLYEDAYKHSLDSKLLQPSGEVRGGMTYHKQLRLIYLLNLTVIRGGGGERKLFSMFDWSSGGRSDNLGIWKSGWPLLESFVHIRSIAIKINIISLPHKI